jgi:hypothetical protein
MSSIAARTILKILQILMGTMSAHSKAPKEFQLLYIPFMMGAAL